MSREVTVTTLTMAASVERRRRSAWGGAAVVGADRILKKFLFLFLKGHSVFQLRKFLHQIFVARNDRRYIGPALSHTKTSSHGAAPPYAKVMCEDTDYHLVLPMVLAA